MNSRNGSIKNYFFPTVVVLTPIVIALITIIIVSQHEKQAVVRSDQPAIQELDEFGELWEEVDGTKAIVLDNCVLLPVRNGIFLIRERIAGGSRLLSFSDGLAALERMDHEVRMELSVEGTPPDYMVVWVAKKETAGE